MCLFSNELLGLPPLDPNDGDDAPPESTVALDGPPLWLHDGLWAPDAGERGPVLPELPPEGGPEDISNDDVLHDAQPFASSVHAARRGAKSRKSSLEWSIEPQETLSGEGGIII